MKDPLVKKIEDCAAVVGIVGLGYVGLPLALAFAADGFRVIGFDTDQEKVDKLNGGESYIRHIPAARIKKAFVRERQAAATTDFERIGDCDAIMICVPTPLTLYREPDLTFIRSTAEQIAPFMRSGQLITVESTTYPGTVEEVLVPLLEKGAGLKAGHDFMVAYSPEREDPSNPAFSTTVIPKVVGGLDAESLDAACSLYGRVINETVPVSSCRTAEATKLLENIFRSVNIALVNELKMVFTRMDIDIWEVVGAAATKPFGYMPFYPGPGLGGHCIPIDPFYLTWKAREYGMATRFIELAGEINTGMPDYVITRTILALNRHGLAVKGSRIVIVGLAYKKNVDDERESPSYVLWEKLVALGAKVDYFDPYCPAVPRTRRHAAFTGIRSRTWEELEAGAYDAALIATAHDSVDHDRLAGCAKVVVDTRGICTPAENVFQA